MVCRTHSGYLHTGVEYCLFAQGFTRASIQINEVLHTFVLIYDYLFF